LNKGGGDLLEYEGYGPNGAAVVVQAVTDNRNRSAQKIRKIFSTYGCSLGQPGCAKWTFKRQGVIVVEVIENNEEKILESAIEAGAEDVTVINGEVRVECTVENLNSIGESLHSQGFKLKNRDLTYKPNEQVALTSAEMREFGSFVEDLLDDEDVIEVLHNVAGFSNTQEV